MDVDSGKSVHNLELGVPWGQTLATPGARKR